MSCNHNISLFETSLGYFPPHVGEQARWCHRYGPEIPYYVPSPDFPGLYVCSDCCKFALGDTVRLIELQASCHENMLVGQWVVAFIEARYPTYGHFAYSYTELLKQSFIASQASIGRGICYHEPIRFPTPTAEELEAFRVEFEQRKQAFNVAKAAAEATKVAAANAAKLAAEAKAAAAAASRLMEQQAVERKMLAAGLRAREQRAFHVMRQVEVKAAQQAMQADIKRREKEYKQRMKSGGGSSAFLCAGGE